MRMWTLLELIIAGVIVLIAITEFFLPIILGKPLFGSFRKLKKASQPEPKKPEPSSPLEDKIRNAKGKVEEVKEVQGEVLKNYKSAKDLKKESDDLLK